MEPKNNYWKFYDENSGLDYSGYTFNYAYYIEFRLNNRLLLLSNPDLINQLGEDKNKILEEARKLVSISNIITIPDVVEEKEKKGIFSKK